MPKATGVINSHLHGKLGPITARVVGQETIISQSIEPKETPVRSEDQLNERTKFASTAASWKAFRDVLRFTFPKDMPFRSMFSEFMKNNIVECGVYVEKQALRNGTQILNNFVVSSGDLTPIEVAMVEGNGEVFVTNVALDGFTLSESTTVAQFASAVTRSNTLLPAGDMLTILFAAQNIGDGGANPSDIEAQAFSIPLLDVPATASVPLSSLIPLQLIGTTAFTQADGSVRNVLTLKRKPNLMATVIHSREVEDRVVCSFQRLVGTTTILERYTTAEAREKSFKSYGGVNHRNRYRPNVERLLASLVPNSPNLAGGTVGGTLPGGGSGTGTGSDPTNPGGSGGGSNPGGGPSIDMFKKEAEAKAE